ncbi:MAG TPA: hypothetical protein VFN31_00630 [Candidatus Saccharimonadales bacterium]|nr:hypothetical protein [Candidatus Saccharimonadales bacterium]
MSERLSQEDLDIQKILAFGEHRLVGVTGNRYYAPSLVGVLTVKPEAVLQSSHKSDEESAFITQEEASYAVESYRLDGLDIIQSINNFRTIATKTALANSTIDQGLPIC